MFEHVLVALDALLEDRPELAPPLGLVFLVAGRSPLTVSPREPFRTLVIEVGGGPMEYYGETWIHPVAGEEDRYRHTRTGDESGTETIAGGIHVSHLFGTLAEMSDGDNYLGIYAMRWTWTRLDIVRRWLTADEIVSVQPLTRPSKWIIFTEGDGD
jgi:hypothetical protein